MQKFLCVPLMQVTVDETAINTNSEMHFVQRQVEEIKVKTFCLKKPADFISGLEDSLLRIDSVFT